MDPLLCWAQLVTACEKGRLADAADRADDLEGWIRVGGVRPVGVPEAAWGSYQLREFARVARVVAEEMTDAAH